MPYALRGSTVVNRATGAPVPGGKHPNRARALAHLRALYANAHEAKDYSAHVGQTIAGRLVRGAGGRFSASGAAPSAPASERVPFKKLPAAPKPKKGKAPKKGRAAAKPKAPRKPVKTPAQRAGEHAAARTAQQSANRKQALAQMRSAPNGAALDALDALKQGKAIDPDMAKSLAQETGLVSIHADGTATLSPSGRHFLNALDRGAAGEAADALSSAQDRQARQAKPKKAGGGGKRKVLKPRATAPARSSSPVKVIGIGGGGGGAAKPARQPRPPAQIPQAMRDAAQTLSDGGQLSQADADALVRNGLARRDKNGNLSLTGQGLRVISMKQIAEWDTTSWTVKAGNPGDYLVVEDPKKSSTWHLQVKTNGKPDHRLMGAAWAALHGGYRGNKYQGPNKDTALSKLRALYTAEKMPLPSEKSFTVFKDSAGNWRWIARTTTAYRDRDGEIISEKALEDDAARMTATGQYGPLRYWHVGQPDPLSPTAPWGPGLDIGDCDFSILIGRTNIESGTFKSAEIGAAFAEAADEHELSPGFFHAPMEPDSSGVFNHIRRFERSTVPIKHGRASNLFTGLTVKEHRMDQQTYEKRVRTYLDFTREKGIPPDVAAAPLAAMQQADKDAAAQHIAYKDANGPIDWFRRWVTGETTEVATKEDEPAAEATPAPASEPDTDPVASLKAELETLRAEVASLKAPPADGMGDMMPDAENPAETGMEAGIEEPVDEGGGGLTLSSEDLAAVGEIIKSLLEPLIGALGITSKLEGHIGELKTLMGGYVTKKDADEAERQNQVAALKAAIDQQQAKLAELVGDEPRNGYRASEASDNVLNPQVLAAIKDNEGGGGADFSDIAAQLFPGMIRR